MREYFTTGIVLDREPRGELDETIIIYTKDFGKVRAFVKSSRKITSKLSGHLTPGRIASIRFVERNKLQLVDALSLPLTTNLKEFLPFLHFINKITPDGDADLNLWYMIEEIVKAGHFSPAVYGLLIDQLGFSNEGNLCHYCQNNKASLFNLSETTLLCAPCQKRIGLISDELIPLEKS